MPDIHNADKIGHTSAYTLLMLWFAQLYRGRSAWAFAAGFIAMGISLEYLQGTTSYRTFDYFDMLANSVGVMLGLALSHTALGRSLLAIEQRLLR